MPHRVCLVTPGHLSTNPRLVKEADALAGAGYEVSVVAGRFVEWADRADEEFQYRKWDLRKVAFGEMASPAARGVLGLRRKVSRAVARRSSGSATTERALHWIVPELTKAACAIPADLYIAHNLAALPAAHYAA